MGMEERAPALTHIRGCNGTGPATANSLCLLIRFIQEIVGCQVGPVETIETLQIGRRSYGSLRVLYMPQSHGAIRCGLEQMSRLRSRPRQINHQGPYRRRSEDWHPQGSHGTATQKKVTGLLEDLDFDRLP